MWLSAVTTRRAMLKKMNRMLRAATTILVAVAATLLLLELGTRALVHADVLEIAMPHSTDSKARFWKRNDPRFGVWHESNAEWVHEESCFKVTYRTNSVGARDRERSVSSTKPRVVVLGDSILEGLGVNDEQQILRNR